MCWLLDFAIPILRKVVVGCDQLVDALHELLGFAGNFKCNGRQCLRPHAPFTATLTLAFCTQVVTALARLHQSLLAVDKAANQVSVAGCFRLRDDLAHGIDDGTDQWVDLVDVGGATNGADEALNGLNQGCGLIIKVNLFTGRQG